MGQTALLVIDVQQGFDAPVWGRRNNPQAEANIARLLREWRLRQLPIFHVRHDSTLPDSPLHPSKVGNTIKPAVKPLPDEPIIAKTVNSALIGTDLEEQLLEADVDSLVIVGLTTNHCVSTTARMAGNLGYETFVVSDATAAFDRPGLDGRMRPAEEVHASALSDLNGEFAAVVDTRTILGA